MKKTAAIVLLAIQFHSMLGQSSEHAEGSYLSYPKPDIEDNSMLVEEAFNQEPHVYQSIMSLTASRTSSIYSLTQEIPLVEERHQVNFTVPVITRAIDDGYNKQGIGDIQIGYRYMLCDKTKWAIVIPKIVVFIPTGKIQNGFGSGTIGEQLAVAATKRVSKRVMSHWNASITNYSGYKHFASIAETGEAVIYSRTLQFKSTGLGIVWYAQKRLNFLLETIANFDASISDKGTLVHRTSAVVNPGIRTALQFGKVQIVPAFGIPGTLYKGRYSRDGYFMYLSVECDFNRK